MAYNTKELLALPSKQKRMLAKQLWKSLDDNSAYVKEDKETIKELERRWQQIKSGKAKLYTSDEFWKLIDKHMSKKK